MNLHTPRNFGPLPSRRALMTGALAGGFVLAFRLPLKAANEPEQPPDNPAGQFAPWCRIQVLPPSVVSMMPAVVEFAQGE